MTFTYPIQDYGPLMKGMVIGGLDIFHVFLAQMSIGGGMLLCYFEWLRRTGRSPNAARFVNGYFQTLVLISLILGAITGLSMWFTSIQVSPRTIGVLVDEFHWIWAIEWTFFCVEVVSGYTFLRYKDRVSRRGRMFLLATYAVAAWFSLFWINGILSFQLTPGRWLETHNVWSGFFNASFWPSFLYRTAASMAIASLVACVVINLESALSLEARRELIGRASVFLMPMVLMPCLGIWFLASMPTDSRSWVLGGSVTMTMFMAMGVIASLLIGAYALGVSWYPRLSINGFTAALLCAFAFAATAGGEFVREGLRKPYSISQVLYSNSLRQDEIERLRSTVAGTTLMNTLFPFGYPWPTAMYLTLFVITAAIYMVFMSYVLAGAIILVVGYLAPGARRRVEAGPNGAARSGLGLIVRVVRDWLPAILGMAITTGIAPLLFLQILYKQQFYTANLLLFNRFMLLLPALIVAYYLLYLIKSHALTGRWAVWRGPVTIVIFLCFSFTAWAWTENHVLSLHPEVWKDFYVSGKFLYRNAEMWPRLGYWITASLSPFSIIVAWQLHWSRRLHDASNIDLATRRLRSLALLGLVTSATEGWLWLIWLEDPLRVAVLSKLAFPYSLVALAGMVIQAGGWLTATSGSKLTSLRLAVLSLGAIATILGALVLREARRLAGMDLTPLFDAHRRAAHVGGLPVFLFFFALNLGVIIGCVLIVRRAFRSIH